MSSVSAKLEAMKLKLQAKAQPSVAPAPVLQKVAPVVVAQPKLVPPPVLNKAVAPVNQPVVNRPRSTSLELKKNVVAKDAQSVVEFNAFMVSYNKALKDLNDMVLAFGKKVNA